MKQLKTKKLLQIDISIQVSILILTFFAIVTSEQGYAFMLFYFVLGGYQMLSFALHYLIRKKRNGNTAVYTKLIFTVVIGFVICILLQFIPHIYGGPVRKEPLGELHPHLGRFLCRWSRYCKIRRNRCIVFVGT